MRHRPSDTCETATARAPTQGRDQSTKDTKAWADQETREEARHKKTLREIQKVCAFCVHMCVCVRGVGVWCAGVNVLVGVVKRRWTRAV